MDRSLTDAMAHRVSPRITDGVTSGHMVHHGESPKKTL